MTCPKNLTIACFLLAASCNAQFSYVPEAGDGPSSWGNLTVSNNQCNGTKNSPIAIKASACDVFADYTFQAGSCNMGDLQFELHSNVVEVAYPNSSVCTTNSLKIPNIDGTYEVKQFHIHTSSEHTIDSNYNSAELHIVHKSLDGTRLAVVGIMIQPDSPEDNPIFEPVLEGWKAEYEHVLEECNVTVSTSTARSIGGRRRNLARRLDSFNAYDLIPSGSTFYNYDGSLTTPPCSEIVWWNVADKPLLVSIKQFTELSTIVLGYRNTTTCEVATIASPSGSTSRPVQPLNGRDVTRICPVGFVDTRATSNAFAVSVSKAVTALMAVALSAMALF